MLNRILNYFRKEDGAVTVDWVVLTAAVVALAGVAITSIQTASGGLGNTLKNYMINTEVK